jgi:hypothetical protein
MGGGEEGSGVHIMFECVTSRFAWVVVKVALGWSKFPTSVKDFFHGWLSHLVLRPNRMLIVCVLKNQFYTHTV